MLEDLQAEQQAELHAFDLAAMTEVNRLVSSLCLSLSLSLCLSLSLSLSLFLSPSFPPSLSLALIHTRMCPCSVCSTLHHLAPRQSQAIFTSGSRKSTQ